MITDSRRISIIIPIYNELDNVEGIMKNLDGLKDLAEIIFVDGGSTDGSDLLLANKFRLIRSDKKGRGNQMNYGVKFSSKPILLFLHGDSRLPKDALKIIGEKIDEGNRVGCFKLKFDSKSLLMKICAFMSNKRVKYRNIAFGDQGIFIDREYFEKLGKYKNLPIMEDYQLSMDVKEDGEKIVLLSSKIITSERRFVENGRIRTMIRMQKLQYLYRKKEDINTIMNLYK